MSKKAKNILYATITLFLKEGVRNITMDKIASNSNSSKVTIYKYFLDKDSLYYEIGKHIYSNKVEEFQNIITGEGTLVTKIFNFMDVITNFTDCGHQKLCSDLSQFNININKENTNYLDVRKRTLVKLIDLAFEQNLIRPKLNKLQVFSYIDMGVEYYQNNEDYRYMLRNDITFSESFMHFMISNIFIDVIELRIEE